MRSLAFPASRRQLQQRLQRGLGFAFSSPIRQEWRNENLPNCWDTRKGNQQPALKEEGSTTIPHKEVGSSDPKRQEARTVYEIVCSAWKHAAAERRIRHSDPDGTQGMSTPTTSAAIRTTTMAAARAPSIHTVPRDYESAAILLMGGVRFRGSEKGLNNNPAPWRQERSAGKHGARIAAKCPGGRKAETDSSTP